MHSFHILVFIKSCITIISCICPCGNKKGNQAISREDLVFSNSMSIFYYNHHFILLSFVIIFMLLHMHYYIVIFIFLVVVSSHMSNKRVKLYIDFGTSMFKWVLCFCGLFNDALYYISVKMHMLLFLWLWRNGFVHLKLRIMFSYFVIILAVVMFLLIQDTTPTQKRVV